MILDENDETSVLLIPIYFAIAFVYFKYLTPKEVCLTPYSH